MSLVLLFHCLLLKILRMLVHPSSGACDLFVELFHGLYCSRTVCVGVTVWFGWGGVVSGCRLSLEACDLLWIDFMCCIALVRCVLVLRCGSVGVVWYPYAG
jgi:hypothetical protein